MICCIEIVDERNYETLQPWRSTVAGNIQCLMWREWLTKKWCLTIHEGRRGHLAKGFNCEQSEYDMSFTELLCWFWTWLQRPILQQNSQVFERNCWQVECDMDVTHVLKSFSAHHQATLQSAAIWQVRAGKVWSNMGRSVCLSSCYKIQKVDDITK